MKSLIFAMSLLFVNNALAAEKVEVTGVFCRGGNPVNFEETVKVGQQLDFSAQDAYAAARVTEVMKQIDLIRFESYLNELNKPQTLVIGVSRVGKDNEYRSGLGPCPSNDLIVVLGKLVN